MDLVMLVSFAELENILRKNKPDFIIIGWSTWEREEWNYQGEYFDVNSSGHNTLPLELQDRYKHWIIEQTPDLVWDKSVCIHEEIFKLHQDLNYLNIKHLFFNCMYKFFNISDFKMWNNSYIGPYDNDSSYYYWLTLQGIVPDEWYHFKEDGHTKWSNKLINYIKENKLL
jgi:hypothetical protein